MKSLHAALALAASLILLLWWAVQPPRSLPERAAPVEQSRQRQCPPHSRLVGQLCACDAGMRWNGAACVKQQAGSPRPGSLAIVGRTPVDGWEPAGQAAIVEEVSATGLTIIAGDGQDGTLARRSASGKDVDEAARKLGIVAYRGD